MKNLWNTLKEFWKTFKEEMLALPLLILGILMFKSFLSTNFPQTAQYDLLSEAESILWTVIKLLTFTSFAWFGLRIIHPPMYRALKNYYHSFERLSVSKRMETAGKVFLVILLSLVTLSSFGQNYEISLHSNSKETIINAYQYEVVPNTNCIIVDGQDKYCGEMCISPIIKDESFIRTELMDLLHAQLDVREATNNNDGIEVEKYLASVGLDKGYAWCAAYTSYNLDYLQVPNPMSAWSPDFAKSDDMIWSASMVKQNKVKQSPQKGDCFTIFYASKQRVGHVGFIVSDDGTYYTTIEGNTNNDGSRLGIGVFKLKRQKSKIYAITNYITPYAKYYENENNNILIFCSLDSNNDEFMQMQQNSFISGNYNSRDRYGDNNSPGERYTNNFSSRYSGFELAFIGRYQWNKGCKQKPIQWQGYSDSQSKGWYSYSNSVLRFFGGENQTERQTYSRVKKQKGNDSRDYCGGETLHTSIFQDDDSSWSNYDFSTTGVYHFSNSHEA